MFEEYIYVIKPRINLRIINRNLLRQVLVRKAHFKYGEFDSLVSDNFELFKKIKKKKEHFKNQQILLKRKERYFIRCLWRVLSLSNLN